MIIKIMCYTVSHNNKYICILLLPTNVYSCLISGTSRTRLKVMLSCLPPFLSSAHLYFSFRIDIFIPAADKLLLNQVG